MNIAYFSLNHHFTFLQLIESRYHLGLLPLSISSGACKRFGITRNECFDVS